MHYRSESPSQVFLILLSWLYIKAKEVEDDEVEEKLHNMIICYDNMCHVDGMKVRAIWNHLDFLISLCTLEGVCWEDIDTKSLKRPKIVSSNKHIFFCKRCSMSRTNYPPNLMS